MRYFIDERFESLNDDIVKDTCISQINTLLNKGVYDAWLSCIGKGYDSKNGGYQIVADRYGAKTCVITTIIRGANGMQGIPVTTRPQRAQTFY